MDSRWKGITLDQGYLFDTKKIIDVETLARIYQKPDKFFFRNAGYGLFSI